jgi:hypothetical protein
VSFCNRGCRLLRVIEVTTNSQLNTSDLLSLCSHACDGAYDESRNVAADACKFGCVSQMSGVTQRRMQLALMRRQMEQLIVMDFISRLYYQLYTNQQQPAGLSSDGAEGVVISAHVLIVASNSDDDEVKDNNNELMMSYKSLQQHEGSRYSVSERTDAVMPDNLPGTHYSAFNDSSIVAMIGISLMLIVGFSCLLITDNSKQPQTHEQKLSIYGDRDELACLCDVDDPLIDVKMRVTNFQFAAPHLPTKTPLN